MSSKRVARRSARESAGDASDVWTDRASMLGSQYTGQPVHWPPSALGIIEEDSEATQKTEGRMMEGTAT